MSPRLSSLFLLTAALSAQQPCELVHDANQTGFERSGSPRADNADADANEFVRCGNHWYFVAQTFDAGYEVWRTDGTTAGTHLVRDVIPGRDSSFPLSLICFQGAVYFKVGGGAAYNGVWRSDGTAAGTTRIFAGVASELGVWGSSLVFTAFVSSTGQSSLYLSDGTAAGTTAVTSGVHAGADYVPLPASNVLMFVAQNGTQGDELWRTDGTAAGTFQVKDIRPGAFGSDIHQLTPVGNRLVFSARVSTTNGTDLWVTDGTTAGTTLLKDVAPASPFGAIYDLRDSHGHVTMLGGDLLFSARGHLSTNFWRTDGTPAGTVQLPIPVGLLLTEFVMSGSVLYYTGQTVAAGEELWRWDGTNASLVRDLHAGAADSSPADLTLMPNGELLFTAEVASTGRELYRTDGTFAGTYRVRDIQAGPESGSPRVLTALGSGSLAIFSAKDPERGHGGEELWITDGTGAGTDLLADINPGWETEDAYGAPRWSSASGKLYFLATTANEGREVWVTDGTAAGTRLIGDIKPGTASSQASQFGDVFDGTSVQTLFLADDGTHGKEPWITDGTPAGTRLLRDINPTGNSNASRFVMFGGRTWFTATTASHGQELWVTDGTMAGTQQFLDVRPGSAGSAPLPACVLGGKLFFVADDGVHGRELWCTDGTVAGTMMLRDIGGASAAAPGGVTPLGGIVLFYAEGPEGGELWRSDGTPGGTVLVTDLVPGSGSSWPNYFTELDGEVIFSASGAAYGIWKTDGTAAGTVPLLSGLNGNKLTAGGGLVFFTASQTGPTTGHELWATDGTAAGTGLVADIQPGSVGSDPDFLTPGGGGVYFRADDGVHGKEVWFSDGTAAGTTLVHDLDPDDHIYHAFPILAHDGGIYFPGYEPLHGSELRVIRDVATVSELGPGCGVAPPTLRSTTPQLGVGAVLSGTSPTANVSALVVGIGRGQPFTLAPILPADCVAWIGLTQPSATVLVFGSQWSYQLAIPASTTFAGVRFVAQVVHASTPLALSRALQLRVGN